MESIFPYFLSLCYWLGSPKFYFGLFLQEGASKVDAGVLIRALGFTFGAAVFLSATALRFSMRATSVRSAAQWNAIVVLVLILASQGTAGWILTDSRYAFGGGMVLLVAGCLIIWRSWSLFTRRSVLIKK